MNTIREMLKGPAVGWGVAGICLAIAMFFFVRSWFTTNPYDLSYLSQTVTVRFVDTDEEITLTRADFEKQLRESPGPLSATTGITNPKTGKPSGILVATREWEETIERLKQERDWLKQNSAFGPASPTPSASRK